jgi:hypothetical protein
MFFQIKFSPTQQIDNNIFYKIDNSLLENFILKEINVKYKRESFYKI